MWQCPLSIVNLSDFEPSSIGILHHVFFVRRYTLVLGGERVRARLLRIKMGISSNVASCYIGGGGCHNDRFFPYVPF